MVEDDGLGRVHAAITRQSITRLGVPRVVFPNNLVGFLLIQEVRGTCQVERYSEMYGSTFNGEPWLSAFGAFALHVVFIDVSCCKEGTLMRMLELSSLSE